MGGVVVGRRSGVCPGGFTKKDAGEGRVKLRLEEREAPRQLLGGQSYCRAFVTGTRFTLGKHSRDDVNAAYVVSRVSHAGTWEGYHNSFEAFPAQRAEGGVFGER